MPNEITTDPKLFGRVHSIETLGTLDGPGLRTVIFFQGCPLNCIFCHNIDAVPSKGGQLYTVKELADKVLKNRAYWTKHKKTISRSEGSDLQGGITLSGGDPLFQGKFITEFVRHLQQFDVHIALDTCLFSQKELISNLIPYVNLWMVSIKHTDSSKHKELTGLGNKRIQKLLKHLDKQLSILYPDPASESYQPESIPKIWIRYLLIPGVTDDAANLNKLVRIADNLKSLELVEILAYGDHAKHKWIETVGSFPMEKVRNADTKDVQNAAEIFHDAGIEVKY